MPNKLNEFMQSLIVAEELTQESSDYFITCNKEDVYLINGFYNDNGDTKVYTIKIDTKNYFILLDLGYNNNKTKLFKKFLNKKFKGTLAIDQINVNIKSKLKIKGNMDSIFNLIASHQELIKEFTSI